MTKWTAYAALVIGITGIAFAGILVRWGGAPGAVTAFYRLIFALLLTAVPFGRRVQRQGLPSRRTLGLTLLGGMFFAGNMFFWTSGVLLSGATSPTLLLNTSPLWVGLGALLLFRERLSWGFWAGLALALTGAGLVLGLDTLRSAGLGTLFGLVAGIFYAGYFLVTQICRKTLDALTYFWPSVACAALCLLAAALALGQPLTGYTSYQFLIFFALGLIGQIVGQFAINYALGFLPASIVSPSGLLQPVLTALFAAVLLGESFTPLHFVGAAAVLTGVFIIHRSRLAPKPVQAHTAATAPSETI